MSWLVILAVVFGAGTGLGLVFAFAGTGTVAAPSGVEVSWPRLIRERCGRLRWAVEPRLLLGCVAAAAATWWWTSWPVAAVAAGIAIAAMPRLLGTDRVGRREVERIEAVAAWTESLRDTLVAAAGLEQAICATAAHAPPVIRSEVTALADEIKSGRRLTDALRRFATRVDDATCDLVVTALVLAAERHARRLSDLLASLAVAARDQAALRMRVAAGRARVRTSTRVITGVTLVMAVVLVVFNRPFLMPYGSLTGQVVLLAVVLLFGLSFAWLSRIAADTGAARALRFNVEGAP